MKRYQPGGDCLIMTRDRVRAFDAWAINELDVPGVVLMENAGRSCAELIVEKLSGIDKPRVCIFCGTGNNGGDGFVIARHLLNRGFAVVTVICGEPSRIRAEARINLAILEGIGQHIEVLDPDTTDDVEDRVAALAKGTDMIVDAIFGTGLTGELRDEYKLLTAGINGLGCPILAVDIPSGLDCDTGQPHDIAVKANCTVTFVAVKKGFTHEDAQRYTGEVYVASIGVEPKYKPRD